MCLFSCGESTDKNSDKFTPSEPVFSPTVSAGENIVATEEQVIQVTAIAEDVDGTIVSILWNQLSVDVNRNQ